MPPVTQKKEPFGDRAAFERGVARIGKNNPEKANALLTKYGLPITSSSLQSSPTMDFPPVKPDTGVVGMLGEMEANAKMNGDAFTQALTERRKQLEQPTESSFQDYLAAQLGVKGETQLTSEAYQAKGGVDDVEKELNDINQQILVEQESLRRKQEALQKRGGGLKSGMVAELDMLESASLRKQADLSVIQLGIQGRYDSAKAIADRAVAVQLERDKTLTDALKSVYERNKELFTTAEQREFDTMLADRERQYEAEAETKKSISDLAIEAQRNGAPSSIASQMRGAKTVEEALEMGGGYIGLLERQKAQSALATDALNRRKTLLEMALAGDKDSITELGFDPTTPNVTDKIKAADQIAKMDGEILRVQQTLENTTGLGTSAGVIRSPFLSSFGTAVPAGTALGFGAGSVIPGLGNFAGGIAGFGTGVVAGGFEYAQQRDQKARFLSDVNYIVANMTAEKVRQLKADGVSFTPMTDKDIELIGRAVGTLGGSNAIRDEKNQVVGFVSEKVAQESLEEAMRILKEARDKEYQKMLSDEEKAEIGE